MLAPKTLQAKLLVSVFLIVTLTVSTLTGLVIFVEKQRSQQTELERIYYKTHAMKTRLGHLMYGKNWRYLMMTLSSAQKSDPSMLFFAITDNKGRVLISDDEGGVGQERFDLTRVINPRQPLYEREASPGQGGGQGEFKIYLSRFSQNTRHTNNGKVKKDELLFEAVYDVLYLGEPMGRFRAGFSRRNIKKHLWVLTGWML